MAAPDRTKSFELKIIYVFKNNNNFKIELSLGINFVLLL